MKMKQKGKDDVVFVIFRFVLFTFLFI